MMPTYQKHLFYTESEHDYKLVLKPIADIKMHYFKTTLLEYLIIGLKCNYRTLPNATTIRIAPLNSKIMIYASVNKVQITPAIKIEDRDCGLTEWKDFKYCSIGQNSKSLQEVSTPMQEEKLVAEKNTPGSSNAARVQAIANKEIKDAIIENWADKVIHYNPVPKEVSLQVLRPLLVAAASNTGASDGTSFFICHSYELLISIIRQPTQTSVGQIHWF